MSKYMKEDYSLLRHNCTNMAHKALDAAGVPKGGRPEFMPGGAGDRTRNNSGAYNDGVKCYVIPQGTDSPVYPGGFEPK